MLFGKVSLFFDPGFTQGVREPPPTKVVYHRAYKERLQVSVPPGLDDRLLEFFGREPRRLILVEKHLNLVVPLFEFGDENVDHFGDVDHFSIHLKK